MDHASPEQRRDPDGTDRSALLMMLAYIEAECRRIGSVAAAQHAALAATLVEIEAVGGVEPAAAADGTQLSPVH